MILSQSSSEQACFDNAIATVTSKRCVTKAQRNIYQIDLLTQVRVPDVDTTFK